MFLTFNDILPFFQIELNEIKPKTLNVTTDGSLIAFAEVKCPLGQMGVNTLQNFPVLDAFLVSVSFDDTKYSTGSPIIVYDSTCTICKGIKGNVDCRMRVNNKHIIRLYKCMLRFLLYICRLFIFTT